MKKKLRRLLALLAVNILIAATRIMPRRCGHALFAFLGTVAFRLYRKERELAMRNISKAFPEGDALIAGALARGTFIYLGRNAFDALRLVHLSRDAILDLCTVEGEEHLRIPYDRGNGVIALTGHIGCWELLAAYFSEKGYALRVFARELHDHRLNDMLVEMRRRHGIVSIPRGGSAVAGYRILKKGGMLGMLIDQDIDVDGTFVPFFGVPAHTPRGAAVFALRSGAPIVPMGIHLQPDGSHRITVFPELEVPPAGLSEQERVDELTARYTNAIERLIRIYPQQWVWFHDRWRKRPVNADSVVNQSVQEEKAGLY